MRAVWIPCLGLVAACSTTTPRLTHTQVNSPAMQKRMAYAVWAPHDIRPDESLPLVVFLHGGGDDEETFDEFAVGQHLDAQLAAGIIPRVVVVVPRGELGFWENWQDGSRMYRDWVVDEVVPAVQARYGTLPCPEGCHVAGVSMGGHGAMRFAFFHPDRFASVSALSAPQLDPPAIQEFTDTWFIKWFVPVERIWGSTQDLSAIESHNVYVQWTSPQDLKGIRLMVGWAEDDREGIILSNRKFVGHLKNHRIPHAALEFPGNHSWKSWTPIIDKVLRFAVWGGMTASRPAGEGATAARGVSAP